MAKRPAAVHTPAQAANLTPEQMSAALPRIRNRIADLRQFDMAACNGRDDPKLASLALTIDDTLARIFGTDSADYKRYRNYATSIKGSITIAMLDRPLSEVRREISQGIARAIETLEGIVRTFEEELSYLESASAEPKLLPVNVASVPSDRVFIVHGHDLDARETVARFVERLGYEAVILHEQPNEGRTIIEKFEKHGESAGFAIVLLTPDDVGGPKDSPPDKLRLRARQNVVAELFYFIGKLGRSHVCALKKGDIEVPSDLAGVVYTSMGDGDGWKLELAREMQAAGLKIDFNKAFGR